MKRILLSLSVLCAVGTAHAEREVFAPTILAPVATGANGKLIFAFDTPFLTGGNIYAPNNIGIGTTGSNSLQFFTNTLQRMHINSAGAIYLGNGEQNATPTNSELRATNGQGTNINGANLSIYGGVGTGSGAGGDITFQTAPAGSSGSSNNTPVERLRINQFGGVTIGNGIDNAAPNNAIIRATGGFGTNIAGGSFSIRGGQSTGNAAGGAVIVETAPAGASGAGTNSVTERMRITSAGVMQMASGSFIDAGGAKFELPNGTALPATCLQGELFHDTDSNDCVNTGGGDGALCICKTTNTWALISNF